MGSIETFSGPRQTLTFDGLLFDFDGTIIDSTEAIVKHWHLIGKELGVDANDILKSSHGRRSIDTLKIWAPDRANWEYVSMIEGRIPKENGSNAVEIPGARKLLDSLDEAKAPWAVVTSGTKALVDGWVDVMKLAHPQYLVVAEDVPIGKPDPTCYLLGRSRLNLGESTNILVVEDAPSGISAGKSAGFKVLAVATTHTIEQLKAAGADWIIEDLRTVELKKHDNGQVEVEIWNTVL